MSASGFVRMAARREMRSKGLSRYDRCSCHPKAWGLKKGLRRGRRRWDKQVIQRELTEV